jgi:predicted deacylase
MIKPIEIGGVQILAGETKQIDLPTVPLYTDTSMAIPVFVKRGKRAGPTLLVSAAIHGDELNGIEIISRLINSKALKSIKGTLIAVPFVNGYGVLSQSRYLPDRRDLNRCFPGSKKGSLAGRIAHLFLNEIALKCDVGIDLHTGAIHRSNLPQIRADLDDPKTLELAKAFGVPVLIDSSVRDGSMRGAVTDLGVPILLYEAGEALRFDELSIRAGVKGVLNVMRHLGMLNKGRARASIVEPFVARQSGWTRATESGFVSHEKQLGDFVEKGDALATIKDPFGKVLDVVKSHAKGVIIGKQNIPLAQEGEAMYHIAYFHKPGDVVENIELMQDTLIPDDEITSTVEL